MTKIAIVRLSDIAREGRWDAPFHIALATLKTRVETLRTLHTADAAADMVCALDFDSKRALQVLLRSAKRFNAQSADAATREYPHLALALVEGDLQPSIERITDNIRRDQALLAQLLALSPAAGKSTP